MTTNKDSIIEDFCLLVEDRQMLGPLHKLTIDEIICLTAVVGRFGTVEFKRGIKAKGEPK